MVISDIQYIYKHKSHNTFQSGQKLPHLLTVEFSSVYAHIWHSSLQLLFLKFLIQNHIAFRMLRLIALDRFKFCRL